MLFGTNYKLRQSSNLYLTFCDGSVVNQVDSAKYLGLWFDTELNFKSHVDYVIKRTYATLNPLFRSANCFTQEVRKKVITQLVLPIIDYADTIYQNTYFTNLKPLNTLFNTLCRFILKCPFQTHHCLLYEKLNWLQPQQRRHYHWIQFIFKCIYFGCPQYLNQYLTQVTSRYSLRSTHCLTFTVPRPKKEIGRRAFRYKAPYDWNELPISIRTVTSLGSFKEALLSHLQSPCLCL